MLANFFSALIRELYNFTVRNAALFEAWFSCMDASLVRDGGLGLIRLYPSIPLSMERKALDGAVAFLRNRGAEGGGPGGPSRGGYI
ncbi:MAG: hypothetical protein LBH26_08810 [Treponema sp.]|nr:hypothetical protein [Treponema sp.]